MISPGSPATFSTFNLSSAATRYCLPPVLMTANIFPSCSCTAAHGDPRGTWPGFLFSRIVPRFSPASSGKNTSERARRPVSRDAYGGVGRGCQGTATGKCTLFARARRHLMSDTVTAPALGKHGASVLPAVEVDSYNLELKDDEGFFGDRASRQAFHAILENWRKPLRKLGADPFRDTPSDELSRPKVDAVP